MEINGVEIEDTYAEAFPIKIARVLITAATKRWAQVAATEATGFGTVITSYSIHYTKLYEEKGFISRDEAEQLSERDAIQLIFAPGLTTASTVTDLSGRGVGMDVVKNRIERLGGSVKVESKPGFGSRFELRLPITIALYQAMLVKVGMERYAIPFTSIVKSISVRKEEVRHIT